MLEFGQFKNFESIDSTNRYCADLLSKTNPIPFTVISADYQSGGVGQIGSKWISSPGQNVLMSIIVYPGFINASSPFKLHFMASLACVEVLKGFVDESRISIKWPNDILVDRKKISGILIKNTFLGNSIRNSIIGFGLNVNQLDFDTLPQDRVTSIAGVTGRSQNVQEIRMALFRRFRQFYQLAECGTSLKELYMMMLYGYDEPISYLDLKDHQYKTGKIRDVRDNGYLVIENRQEDLVYDFKEIKFLFNE